MSLFDLRPVMQWLLRKVKELNLVTTYKKETQGIQLTEADDIISEENIS